MWQMPWLFNLIGKIFFPRQQDWERSRSAKIMLSVVAVSLVLGVIIWKAMKLMNRIK